LPIAESTCPDNFDHHPCNFRLDLQKESKYQEIRIAAVLLGEKFKKLAKYVEQDRRLANIVEEYTTQEPLSYLLKTISYHLTF